MIRCAPTGEAGWSPTLTQAERPFVLALSIALLSRGFDGAGACRLLRTLYYGRFEGLKQSKVKSPAGPATSMPTWWGSAWNGQAPPREIAR